MRQVVQPKKPKKSNVPAAGLFKIKLPGNVYHNQTLGARSGKKEKIRCKPQCGSL